MAKLVCTGNCCCDVLCSDSDPEIFHKDSHELSDLKAFPGGDASNAVINLYKLGDGKSVDFVTTLGDDMFGQYVFNWMNRQGIDTSRILIRDDVRTLTSVVLITADGERHFLFHGDSPRRITVKQVIDAFAPDTEYLHLGSLMILDGLEYEHLKELFCAAQARGIRTSFDVTDDPSGEWLARIREGLPYTDLLFASYEEGVALSGGLTDPDEMAAFFRQFGVPCFVLKLGDKGCYATDYQKVVRVPAYQGVPVVDTTGAGDAFVTAYLYGLMHHLSMEECCILGCAYGALAVGGVGATAGTGSLDVLTAFLREKGTPGMDPEELIRKLG